MNQIETDNRLRMANLGARLTMAMATFGVSVEAASKKTGFGPTKVLSVVTGQPGVTMLDYDIFAAAVGCRINIDVVALEAPATADQSAAAPEKAKAPPADTASSFDDHPRNSELLLNAA